MFSSFVNRWEHQHVFGKGRMSYDFAIAKNGFGKERTDFGKKRAGRRALPRTIGNARHRIWIAKMRSSSGAGAAGEKPGVKTGPTPAQRKAILSDRT